jgi:hypothetical protein
MALPERRSASELKYSCRLSGAKLLSSARAGELSDEVEGLKLAVEGHFMTPGLLARVEQKGGVVILTDGRGEFVLKATALRRPEGGVTATLTYPESYGELNSSPKLNKYEFRGAS